MHIKPTVPDALSPRIGDILFASMSLERWVWPRGEALHILTRCLGQGAEGGGGVVIQRDEGGEVERARCHSTDR